jgi:hypothetical protein
MLMEGISVSELDAVENIWTQDGRSKEFNENCIIGR